MPIHIEDVTTDVMAYNGEIPLSQEHIEMLVRLVIRRIEERRQDEAVRGEATRLRTQAAPGLPIEPAKR